MRYTVSLTGMRREEERKGGKMKEGRRKGEEGRGEEGKDKKEELTEQKHLG